MARSDAGIAVVGAGIGGLTAALALWQEGIAVRVFERTAELQAAGAGIQISPNASRLLLRLGLGAALEAVAVRPQFVEMRRWDGGRILARLELGAAVDAAFGAPYYTIHRADLQRVLLRALPSGLVELKRECIGIHDDADGAELRFAEGSAAKASAVIGADGLRSALRRAVVDDGPLACGQGAYRVVVPRHAVRGLEGPPGIRMWLGAEKHAVSYAVHGGAAQSLSIAMPVAAGGEAWTSAARPAEALAQLRGWDPLLISILEAADETLLTVLHDRDNAEALGRGRLTLLGDAAHPMLPFFAQGGAQAIEDAWTVAACLRGSSAATRASGLRRYEATRRPRVDEVHARSRANEVMFHLADGEAQERRDQMLAFTSLDAFQWLYGYDAQAALEA